MKFYKFFTFIFLAFFITLSSEVKAANNYPESANHFVSEVKVSDITYERVYEDGMWWIVIYCDGIKINQYPDLDQD